MDQEFEDMKDTLRKNRKQWLKTFNAVDVTVGLKEVGGVLTDELCYRVWVEEKKHPTALSLVDEVPKVLENLKTDVKEYEPYQALETWTDNKFMGTGTNIGSQSIWTDRMRPVRPGASMGNISGPTGTDGPLYKRDNSYFILTNGHVAAEDPFKYVGDQRVENLQPGVAHGGKYPDDYIKNMRYMILLNNIANLEAADFDKIMDAEETFNIQYNDGTTAQSTYNTADAALVGPLEKGVDAIAGKVDIPEIIAKPGMKGQLFSWKMDGVSEFMVTDVGIASTVDYKNRKVAFFRDVIRVTKCGGPGSSGSNAVILLEDGRYAELGLNFAGNNTSNLICAIQHINVAFDGGVVTTEDDPPEPPDPPIPPQPPQELYAIGAGLVALGALLIKEGDYAWGVGLIITGLAVIVVSKEYAKRKAKKYLRNNVNK